MKITKALLIKVNACGEAQRVVAKALPFEFNTDPEKNIDLALKLILCYRDTPSCQRPGCVRCHRNLMDDLHWFASQVNVQRVSDSYTLFCIPTTDGLNHEIMLVAQNMAMIADAPKKS